MTTITATVTDTATVTVTVTVTLAGRTYIGSVTPADAEGAPSVDCWMSSSLIALCDEIPEAPEYALPMWKVLLAEARAALSRERT